MGLSYKLPKLQFTCITGCPQLCCHITGHVTSVDYMVAQRMEHGKLIQAVKQWYMYNPKKHCHNIHIHSTSYMLSQHMPCLAELSCEYKSLEVQHQQHIELC